MATAIASIPVLTGEVAERFEEQAQKTYEEYLHRSKEENKRIQSNYEKGIQMVRAMLNKSKLDIR